MPKVKTQEKANKATVRAARGEAVKAARLLSEQVGRYERDEEDATFSDVVSAAAVLDTALSILDGRLADAKAKREMQEA